MKLFYLETSEPGLRWLKGYYRQNPQLNLENAAQFIKRAEQVLLEFPEAGKMYEDFEKVREYKIQGTAFSFLYTVSRKTVWIIDVRDQRGQRSAEALETFNARLRVKYKL